MDFVKIHVKEILIVTFVLLITSNGYLLFLKHESSIGVPARDLIADCRSLVKFSYSEQAVIKIRENGADSFFHEIWNTEKLATVKLDSFLYAPPREWIEVISSFESESEKYHFTIDCHLAWHAKTKGQPLGIWIRMCGAAEVSKNISFSEERCLGGLSFKEKKDLEGFYGVISLGV